MMPIDFTQFKVVGKKAKKMVTTSMIAHKFM